mmetsp:Transcript_18312/g.53397  ORF Transcript_18312/g.53397 Transcript_18312/m.53397 type:complete len:236 (+) Transcript_18312:121-828(+)
MVSHKSRILSAQATYSRRTRGRDTAVVADGAGGGRPRDDGARTWSSYICHDNKCARRDVGRSGRPRQRRHTRDAVARHSAGIAVKITGYRRPSCRRNPRAHCGPSAPRRVRCAHCGQHGARLVGGRGALRRRRGRRGRGRSVPCQGSRSPRRAARPGRVCGRRGRLDGDVVIAEAPRSEDEVETLVPFPEAVEALFPAVAHHHEQGVVGARVPLEVTVRAQASHLPDWDDEHRRL